jgi:hypothetical protein
MSTERDEGAISVFDVVDQIRRYLSDIEVVGDLLDVWQSDMLARAIAQFSAGSGALAMDTAFRASRPKLYRTSAAIIALSGSPTLTLAEVRAELERVANSALEPRSGRPS